jgi:hypothetical protein
MWRCKLCGGEIKQHTEEGVLYSYSLDKFQVPISSTKKLENETGWYDRILTFSCQHCGAETDGQIEKIADWIE